MARPTVAEVIAVLKECPQDAEVFAYEGEGGASINVVWDDKIGKVIYTNENF